VVAHYWHPAAGRSGRETDAKRTYLIHIAANSPGATPEWLLNNALGSAYRFFPLSMDERGIGRMPSHLPRYLRV
jgi:hypothetical protein